MALRSILKTAGIFHCLTLLIDLILAFFFTKTVAFSILLHILPVCPGARFVVKISRKRVGG